jgi:hypothetical protein
MQSPHAYRRLSGDCLRRAGREPDLTKRALYVMIASSWNSLANHVEAEIPRYDERDQLLPFRMPPRADMRFEG